MRTTPLSVRASPTPVVAHAESSTETQQDGQGEARTQRLASDRDIAGEVEVEENSNAVAWWLLSHQNFFKGTKSVSPQPADGNCREFDWDMESHTPFLDWSISMPHLKIQP